MNNKLQKVRKHAQLTLIFAAVVFLILFITLLFSFLVVFALAYLGLLQNLEWDRLPVIQFVVISLIAGTLISSFIAHMPLKPFREIMDATDKIAEGDYSVRLPVRGPSELRDINLKFNHMAEELGSVEMLRSDFVNNFSHEFKTPIVSIRGFARMLQMDDLTKEERQEYLEIIVQESERLSELSSNVLNLSKIEQQTILTDQKVFNVSEQIRQVIAMMDSKWSAKKIEFVFDSEEFFCNGNEEMLQQVWINLFDNAIKFSPEGGTVQVNIHRESLELVLTVANEGEPLSEQTVDHMYDKFYQGDTSHAVKGNGLGLTIAKKIVELHKGQIRNFFRGEKWVVFEVRLPD